MATSHSSKFMVRKGFRENTCSATTSAPAALLGHRAKVTARRVSVNGEPGVLAWRQDGRPLAVMACTVKAGRIIAVESITDPAQLAAMHLPHLDDPKV